MRQSFLLSYSSEILFPFGDTILQDLGIVQPTKTKSCTVSTIKRLAKRFPQIELDSPDSLHLLAQEFTDFLLSPEDLPALRYYKDCNEVEKLRPGFVGGKLVR